MTSQSGWELLEHWPAEIPLRCQVCGEVYVGRELRYIPAMCERSECPGPGPRITVSVQPIENVEIAKP